MISESADEVVTDFPVNLVIAYPAPLNNITHLEPFLVTINVCEVTAITPGTLSLTLTTHTIGWPYSGSPITFTDYT